MLNKKIQNLFILLFVFNTVSISVKGRENGYYVDDEEYLIHCTDQNECTRILDVSTTGYYFDQSSQIDETTYSKLIFCKDATHCKSQTMNKGYYIDAHSPQNIIHCVNSIPYIACSSSPHNDHLNYPIYYFDPNKNRVITCTAESCDLVDSYIKGYFLNSGDDSDNYKSIQCSGESTKCSKVKTVEKCYKAGCVFYNKNYGYSDATILLCLRVGDEGCTYMYINNNMNYFLYNIISKAENDFPGAKANEKVTVLMYKDGTALMYIDDIPTCANAEGKETPESTTSICKNSGIGLIEEGNYCKMGSNIYKSGNNSCELQVLEEDTLYFFFCTHYNSCIRLKESEITTSHKKRNVVIYKLISDEKKKLVKLDHNNVCFIINKSVVCGLDADGGLLTIPTFKSDHMIDGSSVIDSSKNEYSRMIICTSSSSCISKPAVAGYYIDALSKKTNIIKCEGEPVTCTIFWSSRYGDTYFNGGIPDINSLKEMFIQYNKNGYILVDGEDNGYYLVENDLIHCTLQYGCIKVLDPNTDTFYLDQASRIGETNIYKNIIYCESASNCYHYMIYENRLCYQIDVRNPENIFRIDEASENYSYSSVPHGGTFDIPTHYLGCDNFRIITCNDAGCYSVEYNQIGYFINSGSIISSDNYKVIKCNDGDNEPCDMEENKYIYNECSGTGMICIDDIINPKTVILCLTDECEKDSEKVEIKTDPNAVAITVSFPPNSYLFGVKGNQNVDVKLNNDGTAMIVKDMCVFNESKDGRCIPSGDCHKCSKGYIPMVPSEAKAGDKVKIVNFKYDESPSCEFVDVTGYFVGPTGFYVQCIKSKGCKLMANPDGSESLPSKYTFGNMDYFDDSLYLNMGHYQEEEEGKMINYFFKFPMSYKPEKKYLISHNPYYYESGKKVGIFNWHDEADYYVVNYGRNYVLFDSTFNKHEYCSINNNKLLINNKDFCSAESFGKYYDCIDGICKSKDKTKNTRSDEIEKNYEIVSGNKSLDEYKEEDPIVGLTLCTSTEFNELCNSGEITKDHFCITKDGELYKSITDHCQLQYKGIYIFEFDENSYKSIYTTTNGILIYSCDNYKTCSQFINSAYYDVTKKMFYKCSLGQCQKYKGIDEINSGYYVSGATDNNKKYSELIQCTGSTVNTCSKVTTINNGYYLNGKAINLTYALIKCEEGKCIEIKSVSKGYYHSAESTKPLIYCDRVCELTEGISNSNYIIDQDSSVNESTKFITCVDTTHCSSDIVSSSGFFIDGSSSSDIILCSVYQSPTLEKSIRYYYDGNDIKTVEENNSENKYIKCENIPHKGTDKAPMNFLTDTGIIHCISSGCSFIQAPETAEANFHVSNNQDLLMCNNSKCYKVVDVKSKPYAYISASDSDYKTLIFCEPGEEKNICIENDISNKINTKGSLFFIDGTYPSKIISCTSSEGCKSISLSFNLINETLYFIDGTDVKNIITCSKDGCNRGNKITGTLSFTDGFDSSKTIFCVEGKECISSKSIDYCSKINENEACEINSIKINNGMHCIKDGHIYQSINDKDNSYCVKISNGEIMLKKGMNGYEKGIFGVDSGLIYSCTTSDGCIQLLSTYYLRIEIDDVKNNVNRFLYTCNIDGDCYSENKIAKGYYLSKIKENGMNTLIYCSSSEVSNCQHSSEIDKNGNMLFEIPNGQFLDQGNTKNIIKCPSGKNCESEMGITDFGYAYIDNENFKIVDNPVSPKQKIKIYPSVILCTKEFGCKSYLGETTKDYGYINSNNKEVIVCTANYGCEIPIEHTSTTYYNYAMDPIYIITWPYPNDNCIINKDCNVKTGINCVDKTYYLVNDIKDYMVQTNKDTPSPLFYCKATNNKTIKCNEVNGIGYYINNEKEIYTCTKDGCTGSEFDKNTTGKIVATDYYQFKIYLTMNITTKLKSPAKNYMVAHEGAGNIFGTKQNGEYAIITVDENSATLNTTIESNHGSFFYTNSDTNEILKGGECPISSIIELAISEYICTKESNICTEIIY